MAGDFMAMYEGMLWADTMQGVFTDDYMFTK